MSGLTMSMLARELDDDALMETFRGYVRIPVHARSIESNIALDVLAHEFARRHRPADPDPDSRDGMFAEFHAITREQARVRGLLGDCVRHAYGWEFHMRTGLRWPSVELHVITASDVRELDGLADLADDVLRELDPVGPLTGEDDWPLPPLIA